MAHFNSGVSMSFVVISKEETPTYEELMEALQKRLETFKGNEAEAMENFEPFDTMFVDDDGKEHAVL